MKSLIKSIAVTALAVMGANAMADDHGSQKDIVDTAIEAGSFNTLVTAVQAAGLVENAQGRRSVYRIRTHR